MNSIKDELQLSSILERVEEKKARLGSSALDELLDIYARNSAPSDIRGK